MSLSKHISSLIFFLIILEVSYSVKHRAGKFLNPVNILTFKNEECTSNIVGSNGFMSGVCYTGSECSDRAGTSAGNCASGFGICCLIFRTSGTVSNNCTYLRNEGFPSSFSGNSNPSYTIRKCSDDVCAVRLDFLAFDIAASSDTTELDGGVCVDSLRITSSSGVPYPEICGQNRGQHVYIELGADANDFAQLDFTLTSTGTRTWDLKASQIPCGANYRNMADCFQYHTGVEGRIETFNFADENGIHPANLQYSACIRQEKGYCCVEYTPCADQNSNTILVKGNAFRARNDFTCTERDKIFIVGANDICTHQARGFENSRICGQDTLAAQEIADNGNTPANGVASVCDCSEPFQITIHTDDTPDRNYNGGNPNGINALQSRGVCVNYRQIPCAARN